MQSLFHSAVYDWFTSSFEGATDVQLGAWKEISQKKNTLIAAPTGSGKTLAAFLSVINQLVEQGLSTGLQPGIQVVYVSPLKALSNDIEKNLQFPLRGIREKLFEQGFAGVPIEVMVRTGDTPQADRTAMLKHPPHILVTTPESLYILLTTVNGRKALSNVHTLIVDEIHAVAGDKRGSHLALSVERLEHLTKRKLLRIGVSATQKPIEQVARFLAGDAGNECVIIDTGHKRKMELGIELPRSPLGAVLANEVWEEIYQRFVELIRENRTTLIFVNTRKMSERISHHLAQVLGDGVVMAHHGSMSKDHRFDAEQKLKAGNLKALVATASLELGIDIGSVDLVIQVGTPKSISGFLQRVGRSGHSVKGTPKGKLFPLTRDELVESVALMQAVKLGELDRLIIPEKPVDILAQQIVAECAAGEVGEEEMFSLVKKAYPYRDLTRKEFDEIIKMLADGFTTRRGRRSAYLHHDSINGMLRARKSARLAAILSGGAIPDLFDYDIILEPEGVQVGTLHEDFAIESMPGDIFQLGNNSWKILKIETGKVRVEDAKGQPPSIPFWIGEAPGRTDEFSFAVSRLRENISQLLGDMEGLQPFTEENTDTAWKKTAVEWLTNDIGISEEAADQLVMYLAAAKAALKVIPTQNDLVMERFFDEAGDMHLVIHSPFGNRINKAWGLSLRKRFCRQFNFELQAAATEDAIIISLGATHSFPIDEVYRYLTPDTVRHILVQAFLDNPVFGVRWRWNASRALAVLRRHGDKRVPPQIQRSNSEDLIALVFPDQLACFENIQGEREVPDHPLVNQTIHDCLTEAMDIEGLEKLIARICENKINLHAFDLREASPLSHEILTARPYAFLDDAPLEERRTNAVQTRRWIDPAEAKELGKLDEAAIESVKQEAWPEAANHDELHDALCLSGLLTMEDIENNNWENYLQQLTAENRACVIAVNGKKLAVPSERLNGILKVYDNAEIITEIHLPEGFLLKETEKDPLRELVRGQLEILGPVTLAFLSERVGLPVSVMEQGMLALENEGFVFRGQFNYGSKELEWCERRLLSRIHRYTLKKLRSEIEAVSPADFMRYLFAWQKVEDRTRLKGPEALKHVLSQMEGFEAQAAAWESDILPLRIEDYEYSWLDIMCLSGITSWGRFRNPAKEKSSFPIKTTPVTLVNRVNIPLWKNGTKFSAEHLSREAVKVYEVLQKDGASFFHDIQNKTQLLKPEVEEALSELVGNCHITSDSFTGLRALLVPEKNKKPGYRSKAGPFTMEGAGRWGLINQQVSGDTDEETKQTEKIARVLLRRYGVVFRKLAERESYAPHWRDLVKVLRIMEARGEVRGGRFVTGVWGEQYALPEAVSLLRSVRKEDKKQTLVSISASDPLNLTGIITPGGRISSIFTNRILYCDGVPVAVKEGKEIKFLVRDLSQNDEWQLKNALIQRKVSPRLRAYLGKGIY
ncbi:MAG: DEAD/DEAH box helicase [Bacteroidota bacterium]